MTKGTHLDKDSYSGFGAAELQNKLREFNISEVMVCGLSFDFCVGKTALDANELGLRTYVIWEATRSVSQVT